MQYDKINDSVYANSFVSDSGVMREYRIQTNDYLYVNVTTLEKTISQFMEPVSGLNFLDAGNQALLGYHIADDSTIMFPYLGVIKLGGLTIREAHDTVKKAAKVILGDRVRVDIKLINNYINVIGEVNKEGLYNMTKNKITILEALTLAGGLTEYARRKEVKVFRMNGEKKEVFLVDVTSGKLIGEHMFYLFPNDVVYVEPMRSKSIGLTPTFSLSLLTTLMTTTLTFILLMQQFSPNSN
jgi:polysaccharide export outer membrane protein